MNKTIISIYDAYMQSRNFSADPGREKFNKHPDPNFTLSVSQEKAEELRSHGIRVKDWVDISSETQDVYHFLKVKVGKYCGIWVKKNGCVRKLDPEEYWCLDTMDVDTWEVHVSPYTYNNDFGEGVTCYLSELFVTEHGDSEEYLNWVNS